MTRDNYKIFSQIADGLLNSNKNFNIEGPCGCDKKGMITNLVNYFKQRDLFQGGIYIIDIYKEEDRKKFNKEIIKELLKNQNKKKQAGLNIEKATNQSLIFIRQQDTQY